MDDERPKKRPPAAARAAERRPAEERRGRERDSERPRSRSEEPHDDEQLEPKPRRGLSRDEQKYFGRNACQAIFDTRPEEIVRVYVSERLTKVFASLLRYCAQEKRAYHVVTPEDLEKVTGSEHHQGIALIAKKRGAAPFRDCAKLTGCFLYLDGVENPHNFGAILRSCGYFTISGVLGARGELPPLSGTVCRTAEGAAEMVSLFELDRVGELAALKKRGFRVVATSSHAKRSLYGTTLPANCVIILGSEGRGISPEVLELADEEIAIPGAGAVESLNVSAACAVVLGEYVRQRGAEKALAKQGGTKLGVAKPTPSTARARAAEEKEKSTQVVTTRNGFHHAEAVIQRPKTETAKAEEPKRGAPPKRRR